MENYKPRNEIEFNILRKKVRATVAHFLNELFITLSCHVVSG
jgi:hypothetical protein